MTSMVLRKLAGLDAPAAAGTAGGPYTEAETVLLLLAALVFVGGLIHVGAAVDHYDEYPIYTVVFSLLAAGQFAWSVLLVRRPSRRVLLIGCSFELAVIALWIVSRTVGVPIAPSAWVAEKVGVADLVESVGELVAVIALLSVAFSTRVRVARAVERRMAPFLLAVVLVSVLFGTSVHAG